MKLVLNLLVMFTATAVSAAGGAHGGDHGVPWGEMVIPQIINSAIFFGLLAYLLAGPIKNSFKERGQKFEAAVKRADEVRVTAERANKEVKDRLEKLEKNAKDSVDEASKEAAALRARMVADAKAQSQKIAQEAERNTQYELEKAMFALRTELVTNSVKIAEDEVRTKADGNIQVGLQGEFLKKVEGVRL